MVDRAREVDEAPRGDAVNVGLKPTMPQKAAGRITEPMVCVPSASVHSPAATAAAEPLLEPPGVCAVVDGVARRPRCKVGKFGGDGLAQN